ncbi:MAG: hypothetical protein FWE34_03880 [Defluviitaleaceae bacterium]|nr:hypothetical protein [Defluviitaleaceae bacterium]
MRIINTYPDLILMYDKMNGIFCMKLWQDYAYGISKSMPIKIREDSKGYDFDRQVLPILTQAINNRDALNMAHNSFVAVTKNIEERLLQVFQAGLDVDIIFYLGLCNGAGWATELDGKSAILLGVEKMVELNWCDERRMIGLIHHELGHILHNIKGSGLYEPKSQHESSVWQLYQEGVAMHCENLLCSDFESYHQSVDDWLDWCNDNKRDILLEYKRRIDANEDAQGFFGDWVQWRGRSNLGYYLGHEFVKSLAQKYSISKLLNLTIDETIEDFNIFAQSM